MSVLATGIGRITTTGTISIYRKRGTSEPAGITAGPDGALWFTNGADSIGRITTKGAITLYTHPGFYGTEIVAGPGWRTLVH